MIHDLRGQLRDGVLANLLQYLALNQASGCLLVQGQRGLAGQVYLERGRVVHAASGAAQAMPAVGQMFTWVDGSFTFRDGVGAPTATINVPLERLLLDASYYADTSGPAVRELSPTSLLEPVAAGPPPPSARASMAAVGLLARLDGRRSLAELGAAHGVAVGEVLGYAQELLALSLARLIEGPRLGPAFVAELTRLVVQLVGPMGQIIVEDALDDLGVDGSSLPKDAVPRLVAEVAAQLMNPELRRRFEASLGEVRARHRA